jgi:hypothetical protein
LPYPFAHPAAVLPMARFGVPSALAIGSVVPDFWYFVPLVARADSHSLAGLAWFCVPAGLLLYLAFHTLLKQPLIELLSPRLAAFTTPGLPAARWRSVIFSLLAGALTHVAWDALTHANDNAPGHNWVQHASTLLGTAVLGAWLWRKLRSVPARPAALSNLARLATLGVLASIAAAALVAHAGWPELEIAEFRRFLRTGGIAAAQASGLAIITYALVWRLRKKR